MKANRLLIVLLVPAFIVAAIAAERSTEAPPPPVSGGALARAMPTVAAPDALSATWFCAAGTATGQGAAEQVVVLENAGAEPRQAVLTGFGDQGQVGSQVVDLAPASRAEVSASSVVSAEWAGVLVEVDGGEVGVQHVLSGPTGRATGPCASAASPSWFLPVGTSVLGVSHHLVLFNPYPDEAVVDLRFETEQDTRTPPEMQGLVVPGGSVKAVDVSAVVTVREQMATEVRARTGLVVAEQVATFGEDADLPQGLAVLLGAPQAAPTWSLPAGPALADGRSVAVVVYNPSEVPAEVDVQVTIDDEATNGVVEPYELTVRGQQYEIVDLRQDERVPAGVGWSAEVQTRNGVDVVAVRLVRDDGTVGPAGEMTTLGSPRMATRWELPLAAVDGAGPASVVVANPGAADVTVSASSVGGGTSAPVDGATDLVVAAGTRAVLDLAALADAPPGSLRVDANAPVVVEAVLGWPEDAGISSWIALPVDGTLAELPATAVDLGPAPTVVLDGVVPEGTEAPAAGAEGSTEGTEAPAASADGSTESTEAPAADGGE